MHRLEVPAILAGLGIDRDDRVREEIVAGTIAAPVVARRSGDRHVEDAALFVERHVPRPHVHARAIPPSVIEPGVVTELAGQRHGVEVPQPLAGAHVERARIAGLGEIHFAGRCAEDRDVLIDRRHAIPRHRDLDDALVAEVVRRCAGCGIERDELRPGGQQDARRETAVARPVGNTARRRPHAGRQRVPPHLFAACRLRARAPDCRAPADTSRRRSRSA